MLLGPFALVALIVRDDAGAAIVWFAVVSVPPASDRPTTPTFALASPATFPISEWFSERMLVVGTLASMP